MAYVEYDCEICGTHKRENRRPGERPRFCGQRCRGIARRRESVADRFWSGVDRSSGPDACWPWKRGRKRHGYGSFAVSKTRIVIAHRFAWELTNGDPGELLVCHRCDNPPCCNPAHLFLGTSKDNVQDAIVKGRPGFVPPVRHGEKNHATKLSADSVREIRARAAAGQRHREIGERFGVSDVTVSSIVRRKTWAHV